MKKFLFVSALIVLSVLISAQETVDNFGPEQSISGPEHAVGDFIISGSPNVIFNYPYQTIFAGGLKMSVFVSKRFSFDTDLVFGKNYLHMGPGIIGIPLWILLFSPAGLEIGTGDESGSFSSFLIELALMICSAEHITYHIPFNNTSEISPFASLLRFKQLSGIDETINPEGTINVVSFALGVEITKYIKHFAVSPYIEYNHAYDGRIRGFNFGIYMGYNRTKRL